MSLISRLSKKACIGTQKKDNIYSQRVKDLSNDIYFENKRKRNGKEEEIAMESMHLEVPRKPKTKRKRPWLSTANVTSWNSLKAVLPKLDAHILRLQNSK